MLRKIWRRIGWPRRHWCLLPHCWYLAPRGQFVCDHHPRFFLDPGWNHDQEDS